MALAYKQVMGGALETERHSNRAISCASDIRSHSEFAKRRNTHSTSIVDGLGLSKNQWDFLISDVDKLNSAP